MLKYLIIFLYLQATVFAGNRDVLRELYQLSDNKSEIITDEFFIGTSSNIEDELNYIFEKQLWVRRNAQCYYPLRYALVNNISFLKVIRELSECDDLKTFVSKFKKNYISFGFASESTTAVASSFGHVFLVFHNDKEAEMDANTIEFVANTENASSFEYLMKGVFGRFYSSYHHEYLFEKIHRYYHQEQREVYLYKTNLNEEKIAKIILYLYELQKAKFKYYFFKKNCSYRINKLLNVVKHSDDSNYFYDLPINVISGRREWLSEIRKFKSDNDKKDFNFPITKKYLFNTSMLGLGVNSGEDVSFVNMHLGYKDKLQVISSSDYDSYMTIFSTELDIKDTRISLREFNFFDFGKFNFFNSEKKKLSHRFSYKYFRLTNQGELEQLLSYSPGLSFKFYDGFYIFSGINMGLYGAESFMGAQVLLKYSIDSTSIIFEHKKTNLDAHSTINELMWEYRLSKVSLRLGVSRISGLESSVRSEIKIYF